MGIETRQHKKEPLQRHRALVFLEHRTKEKTFETEKEMHNISRRNPFFIRLKLLKYCIPLLDEECIMLI